MTYVIITIIIIIIIIITITIIIYIYIAQPLYEYIRLRFKILNIVI